MPPEPEPYYAVLVGNALHCGPLVVRRIGVVAAGDRIDLGAVDVPEWDTAAVRLEGRVLGTDGPWIMALLPEREGVGALVASEEGGSHRIFGLPPGRYRACITAGDRDRRFDLEVPAGPERRDFVVP